MPGPEIHRRPRLSPSDMIYALEMAIACALSYWIITYGLAPFVNKDSDLLGGMWAVVATIFVFRDTHQSSMSAAMARLIATCNRHKFENASIPSRIPSQDASEGSELSFN